MIEVKCEQCGKILNRKPSHVARNKNNFCDSICMGKWISLNKSGINSHNTGLKRSDEFKQKERDAHIGKKASAETRVKMSASSKGRPKSEEHKRKISISNTGKHASEETLIKQRNAKLGKTASAETRVKMSASSKGRPKSEEHKRKIGESQKGKIISAETRQKQSIAMTGKYAGNKHPLYGKSPSIETRNKNALSNMGKHSDPEHLEQLRRLHESIRGENHPSWKGGITPLMMRIRNCNNMKVWRNAVFKKDDYKDCFSGCTGDIVAHHIIPFVKILEKYNINTFEDALNCNALWDVNNGTTMLKSTHLAYHNMYGVDYELI